MWRSSSHLAGSGWGRAGSQFVWVDKLNIFFNCSCKKTNIQHTDWVLSVQEENMETYQGGHWPLRPPAWGFHCSRIHFYPHLCVVAILSILPPCQPCLTTFVALETCDTLTCEPPPPPSPLRSFHVFTSPLSHSSQVGSLVGESGARKKAPQLGRVTKGARQLSGGHTWFTILCSHSSETSSTTSAHLLRSCETTFCPLILFLFSTVYFFLYLLHVFCVFYILHLFFQTYLCVLYFYKNKNLHV